MAKSDKTVKPEKKPAPTIQINRNRGVGGKKRPDLFARLRTEHPLDGLLPSEETNRTNSNIPTTLLAKPNNVASNIEPALLEIKNDPASNNKRNQLAEINKSANLLATQTKNESELLAEIPSKTVPQASKLAETPKPASRTELQHLADLRKSKGVRVQYATRIRQDIKKAFDVFCAEEQIFQQDFVELAGIKYIENYHAELAELENKPASNLALNDLKLITLWKTKPAIINLYLRYNAIFNEKSKWSTRDDDVGVAVNEYDLRVIELGILQTQANRGFGGGGKINSFSYYLPEIRNFAELKMGVATLNTMLEINRQRWRQATSREIDLSFLEEGSEA